MSKPFSIFDAMSAARGSLIPVIMAEETPAQEKPILAASTVEKLEARRKQMSTAAVDVRKVDAINGDDSGNISSSNSRASSLSSSNEAAPGELVEDTGSAPPEALGLGGEFLEFTTSHRGRPSNVKRRRDAPSGERRFPPWAEARFAASLDGYCPTNAAVALHDEITDFVDYMRPTEAEITMRRLVELQIADIARSYWPSCNPVVYGSMSTHLLLPSSDIAMSILDVPADTETALHKLSRAISQQQLCTSTFPQMILGAKVPIVKFTHRLAKVEVDVSINAGDGKRNSDIVREYLREFPEAMPLIMVVKHFLQQRGLNEPYKGGMGSFATTLFVCSFLQHHPIYHGAMAQRSGYGLGRLLVDFFRNFGQLFNHQRVGISLEHGGECFVKAPSSADAATGRPPPPVLVEDPGMSSNNAASSLRHIQSVAQGFSWAFQALTASVDESVRGEDCRAQEVFRRPTILSRILVVDEQLLQRRALMEEAHEAWSSVSAAPGVVLRVKSYKRDEDAPMMRGAKPISCIKPQQAKASQKETQGATGTAGGRKSQQATQSGSTGSVTPPPPGSGPRTSAKATPSSQQESSQNKNSSPKTTTRQQQQQQQQSSRREGGKVKLQGRHRIQTSDSDSDDSGVRY